MTQTKSTTKAGRRGPSTFTLEDNPVDSIIYNQEGVWSWIVEYEVQMHLAGEMVGNPPRKSLVAAIQ
jgi:hypothetical protein